MSLEVECPMLPLENYLPTLSCERQKGGGGKVQKNSFNKRGPFLCDYNKSRTKRLMQWKWNGNGECIGFWIWWGFFYSIQLHSCKIPVTLKK